MSNEKCKLIIEDLEKNLVELKSDTDHILISSEKAIVCCKTALTQMREIVIENGFRNEADEIEFFKNIKPNVYSKLLYNTEVFKVESKRPNSSNKVQRKFLIEEMNKIQSFTNDNLEFFQYYRSNTTNLDDHFFVRGKSDIRLYLSSVHFMIDEQFCTSHDYTVAFIKAYDMLSIYLKRELVRLDTKYGTDEILELEKELLNSGLFWTETKVALVELIYAINSTGALNQGVSDIKVIAGVFEKIFHVELGDPYHFYAEMRLRKKERTKFLDLLKFHLIKRMDETEKKERID